VDRAGLVTSAPQEPQQRRGVLQRIGSWIVAVGALILKLGSLAKFATLFVAFGGYALIWGWKFALGLVVLILVHELGHYLEATREGLNPTLPTFVPFFGAYVKHTRGNPWQTARVAVAGPLLGGLAALVCYLIGRAQGSTLFSALGYTGFMLNLFNLIPVGILDGGHILQSARWLKVGGGRDKATVVWALYLTTAAFCALGLWLSYVPQHRL
jgi:Zn-dependent protease